MSESIPYLPDILEDILKFVSDSNLEYLVLAKNSEKKIKAKLVRDVLFDE